MNLFFYDTRIFPYVKEQILPPYANDIEQFMHKKINKSFLPKLFATSSSSGTHNGNAVKQVYAVSNCWQLYEIRKRKKKKQLYEIIVQILIVDNYMKSSYLITFAG